MGSEKLKKVPCYRDYGSFIPDIISPIEFFFSPKKFLKKVKEINPDIFSFRLGFEQWIFLSNKKGLMYFSQLDYDSVDIIQFRLRMLAMSLPAAPVPKHFNEFSRQTNLVLQDHLNKIGEQEYTEIFVKEAKRYLHAHLKEQGTIKDFFEFIFKMSNQMFSIALLGKETHDHLPNEFLDWNFLVECNIKISGLVFPFLVAKNSNFLAAKRNKWNAFISLIKERKTNKIKYEHPCILDGYIEANEKFDLSDSELAWLYDAMQWAGAHYSGIHSFWMTMDFFSQPELLNEIMKEQDQFDIINWSAIKKMIFLQGCIKEHLRMHSVSSVPRHVLKDLNFDGYKIPKGSVLTISPLLEHFNPAVFTNPDQFNPNRWNQANSSIYSSYIPGGIGNFGCQGMTFTIHFMTALWSVLLTEYRFELNEKPPILKEGLLLFPPTSAISVNYIKR